MAQIFKLLITYPKLAIILRRSPDVFFELVIKMAYVVVAQLHAYFGYGFIRRDKEPLTCADF